MDSLTTFSRCDIRTSTRRSAWCVLGLALTQLECDQAKIEAAQLAAQPHRELRDSVQAGMEAIVSKYSDEEAKYNELKDTQAGFIPVSYTHLRAHETEADL
eukprot:1418411-Rhodomonas_salina.6